MAVTVEDLCVYVGITNPNADQTANLERSLAVAESLSETYFANAFREIPEAVRDQVVLDGASAVLKRKDSVSGAAQYAFENGAPIFDAKDVLSKSMPLIRRYVLPF